MILETRVKKQGNSNVIILPRALGFKPKDKINVIILNKKVSKVKDIFGMFKKEFANVDTDKELKKVKKELWGEY